MPPKPTPAKDCIQTQADRIISLITHEVSKAVSATRDRTLLEFQNGMKPIIESAYNAGKAEAEAAIAGPTRTRINEYRDEHSTGQPTTLLKHPCVNVGFPPTNAAASGEDARASQQLSRLHASLSEFGISVSETADCLQFETTSAWNAVLSDLGITNVHNLREVLDAVSTRLRSEREQITELRKQVRSRDKELHEFMGRVNNLQREKNMLLNMMKLPTLTTSSSSDTNHLPKELADLAVLHLPMDIVGLSENLSGPASSPACQHPGKSQNVPMG